ncbi:3-oxoacyl-[acyl-carrier-protein] synthase II [Algoriphagus ratkowskyi]|uniref:3-oxoacyl-[acyl-carrier-protein] synthase 2 n=1 Tax=Algoriphagus ratkowskyi TaxID=57028 RepID=A0A2W7ST75_9BACT|nr:beta-ketoacyl-ACP synthase II [Algoriphagus ratkowskyi]PZX53892.1 3-oxoacyl-[acyl-carrier-protein] synthase II [Algoriphagus ratkowskyi]TXD76704.1 beta-ketoacyl-ACP synthase II [Algoriphagus ratkowskyi]
MINTTRVVITGLGALSSLGNDVNSNWQNAKEGKSGAAALSYFDTEKFKTRFGCELKNWDPTLKLDRNDIKRSDLYTQYGLYVAAEAMEDAGLDVSQLASPFDGGVIWGTSQGGMGTFEKEMKEFVGNDLTPRFNPFFIPKYLVNMASGVISMKYGFMGINYTPVTACASSNSAIMDAFNYIKWGKAKVIITGGSDAPITEAAMGGFNALKALSTRNENPMIASRPFDVERDGFVMGEGAAALILEEYEHAKKRGAKIYGEVVGAAMTADAYHLTATHPQGEGAYMCMKFALQEAGLSIQEVDYLNAHATSTPTGDLSEIKAISRLLEGTHDNMHISATKSMTGHLLGAAGAIEAIFCVKAINDGIIPPTINTENLDPAIPEGIQIVTKHALEKKVKVALSNTFGFGGHNASVIFKEFV